MAQPARAMTMTAEEFLAYSVPDAKAELFRGELRVTPPPGGPHGAASSNLIFMVAAHVREHALGRAFVDGIGYELVRLPGGAVVPGFCCAVAEIFEGIARD